MAGNKVLREALERHKCRIGNEVAQCDAIDRQRQTEKLHRRLISRSYNRQSPVTVKNK